VIGKQKIVGLQKKIDRLSEIESSETEHFARPVASVEE
jgi:hypothetical protein